MLGELAQFVLVLVAVVVGFGIISAVLDRDIRAAYGKDE